MAEKNNSNSSSSSSNGDVVRPAELLTVHVHPASEDGSACGGSGGVAPVETTRLAVVSPASSPSAFSSPLWNSPESPKYHSKSCTTPPRHYHETCHALDASSIQHLFDNNKKWREKKQRNDAQYFEHLAEKQTPRYLWIGCSDSRVPAEEVTGLRPGEMFVHRNVANLVVSNDVSSLAVIQFAVEKLRVRDIIICGHYGCGGVRAAMENKQLGLLDNWLRNIRDVCRMHQTELLSLPSDKQRFHRIVELNIIEQCLNVFKINMVQRNQQKYGFPRIHGVVYDIHTGVLKQLDIDYQGYLKQYSGIYRLHAFSTDEFPPTVQQMRRNMIHSLAEGHEEDEISGTVSVRYIVRVMKSESDLFSPQEVDASIEFARLHEAAASESNVDSKHFVKIESIVRFFAPRATDGEEESIEQR